MSGPERATPLPVGDPSWQPTNPVNLSIAEECLGTFTWLRSAWGGDHQGEAMRRAMEHALEGWEPPSEPPWRTAFDAALARAVAAESRARDAERERDAARAALEPFSAVTGELFARNYNLTDEVLGFPFEGGRAALTFADFLAARAALTDSPKETSDAAQ